jgi:hypothetical protein
MPKLLSPSHTRPATPYTGIALFVVVMLGFGWFMWSTFAQIRAERAASGAPTLSSAEELCEVVGHVVRLERAKHSARIADLTSAEHLEYFAQRWKADTEAGERFRNSRRLDSAWERFCRP